MADQTSARSDGGAVQPGIAAGSGHRDGVMSAASGACDGRPIDLDLPRLVADHAEELYRYAYRLTGSVADAEDLTQQTFMTAHEKLSQFAMRRASGAGCSRCCGMHACGVRKCIAGCR